MKMKQISDSTLKITIKMEDLEERGMEIADFLVPQEKTEEFFYTVLDELDLPMTFRESGMLSFRVTPKPDKVDIFVTKSEIDQQLNFDDFADIADLEDFSQMSPDEFLKTLEKNIREKSLGDGKAVQYLEQAEQEEVEEDDIEDRRYIYYILDFANLQEVVQFVSSIDFTVEESELYKMNDRYYMTVLINIENRSTAYPDYILSRMLEHADDTSISRAVLQEHGVLLLPVGAVDELGKVSLV
ncbi:adaptor protein MecA [Streptococcus azizii]|uniref:Adapter protein MecA n=1 Tax=Streptococcus azizii TaxID=1579424 RepID=A0AB36JRE5_9STRE|nr:MULTISPECIES: adaptor protein MecA [Streptococcus]MBF0776425.1 adaptor protein MecA [Streptococcus sp. 19428wD3_AN2]ONK25789.1 adaptor protein MecA [Streptococcus azizii]ONK30567.1 adaptor protein MecA [Streptococcus azizii]ONK30954.1 adaptor protein MecA [Streptococcus azizii]TFU83054.1 adaptor protein MecA [Streptococcus sp. AN2]